MNATNRTHLRQNKLFFFVENRNFEKKSAQLISNHLVVYLIRKLSHFPRISFVEWKMLFFIETLPMEMEKSVMFIVIQVRGIIIRFRANNYSCDLLLCIN